MERYGSPKDPDPFAHVGVRLALVRSKGPMQPQLKLSDPEIEILRKLVNGEAVSISSQQRIRLELAGYDPRAARRNCRNAHWSKPRSWQTGRGECERTSAQH